MSHRIREADCLSQRCGRAIPRRLVRAAAWWKLTRLSEVTTRNFKPKGEKRGRGFHHKNKILSLVDRNTGRARSFVVDDLKRSTLEPIIRAHLAAEAKIMTDEAAFYTLIGREFAGHGVVRHQAGEYVSKVDRAMHTSTIEGFFGVFKRGMKGVYQHCVHNHLHRYAAEFGLASRIQRASTIYLRV